MFKVGNLYRVQLEEDRDTWDKERWNGMICKFLKEGVRGSSPYLLIYDNSMCMETMDFYKVGDKVRLPRSYLKPFSKTALYQELTEGVII